MKSVVISELLAIEPMDSLERAHLTDALTWVESNAPIFRVAKPALPPKHLVSYFAVVDNQNILLVDHKNAQLWLPPGGHVEPDEHPRATVARELSEELGLTVALEAVGPPVMVTVTETVGVSFGHTDVSLWYVIHRNQSTALTFDQKEFRQVQWFPFGGIPVDRCEPHLERFIAKVSAPL